MDHSDDGGLSRTIRRGRDPTDYLILLGILILFLKRLGLLKLWID